MHPYYDQDVRVWARERAREVELVVARLTHALSNRRAATWLLGSVGLVFVIYGIAFALQSRSAENFCLKERHASAFYVSPWTLTRYCTFREATFEVGDL
jgi:hypothetical protein